MRSRLACFAGLIVLALVSFVTLSLTLPMQKGDLRKFTGTWVAVSTEIDGKTQSALEEESYWVFTGDRVASRQKGKPGSGGTVRLDSTKAPKAIDIDFRTPEGETGILVGIYQFRDDGTLWLAFAGSDAVRPAEFPTKPGSGHRRIEFERKGDTMNRD